MTVRIAGLKVGDKAIYVSAATRTRYIVEILGFSRGGRVRCKKLGVSGYSRTTVDAENLTMLDATPEDR